MFAGSFKGFRSASFWLQDLMGCQVCRILGLGPIFLLLVRALRAIVVEELAPWVCEFGSGQ